ncbi:hypothetical protein GCM10017782_29930 [Deinococcus ficus]|nr:hypothetical protein GCM10017782_29930 [Deinococcus ficus]
MVIRPFRSLTNLRSMLRAVPRRIYQRELLLLLAPAALSVTLLLNATQPAYRTLIERESNWQANGYQSLVQDVQAYYLALQDPTRTAESQEEAYQRAVDSSLRAQNFTQLPAVEAEGDMRLLDVQAALAAHSPDGARQALNAALRLNSQALQYARVVETDTRAALLALQRALLITAFLTALFSMLLTVRALVMWRAERERRTRRETRQRQALSLANHELRRPLQRLLLATDLLRTAPGERQGELLDLIDDSVMQLSQRADLTRLHDLYLDVTLRVQHVDLGVLVRSLSQPRVSITTPPTPLFWPVDAHRVQQLIENLLENALKYTTGRVDVTLYELDGHPEVSVRDYGEGIRESLHEQLFLPYERGPRGLAEGQGLGLSLVRRYARAHGGDVTLRNAQGGGLIATLILGQPSPLLTERARTD